MIVREMEKRFGVRSLLHVDNLFDRGHLLQPLAQDLSFVVVAAAPDGLAATRKQAADIVRASGLTPFMMDVPAQDDPQDLRQLFKAMMGVSSNMI